MSPWPLFLEAPDSLTQLKWQEAIEHEIRRLKHNQPLPPDGQKASFSVFNARLRRQMLVSDEIRSIDGIDCASVEQFRTLTKGKLSVKIKIFRPHFPKETQSISLVHISGQLNHMNNIYQNYASRLPAEDVSNFNAMIHMRQFNFLRNQVNEQLKAEGDLVRAVRLKNLLTVRHALLVSGIPTFATDKNHSTSQDSMVLLHHGVLPSREEDFPVPPIALSVRSMDFKLALAEARWMGESAKTAMQHLQGLMEIEATRRKDWERFDKGREDVGALNPGDYMSEHPMTLHKHLSAAVVNALKNGLSESGPTAQEPEGGLGYKLMKKVNDLIKHLAEEKKAVRQLKACTKRSTELLKYDSGLKRDDLKQIDRLVKSTTKMFEKRRWSKYTGAILGKAVAAYELMEKQLTLQNQLRSTININRRRTLANHQEALLRGVGKIDTLLVTANELGCTHLLIVKEAKIFVGRVRDALPDEPSGVDKRFGGPVELTGDWRGKSVHEGTGDETLWEDVRLRFTPDEHSGGGAIGTLEGQG